jgi:thioredoxin reductase (NADPH)
MITHKEARRNTTHELPVLLIVDANPEARAAVEAALLRRFAADYRVLTAASEALAVWTRANRPRHEVVRVLGERWSPHSHQLRDALGRNTVLFGFYDADSEEGRRLLHTYGVEPERLPAVVFHDGTVLHQPTLLDVADALGVHTRPSEELYDFETSLPGVLAVGDARHGSLKRVAGAVGEGSVAVGSVHQYLAELAASGQDAT